MSQSRGIRRRGPSGAVFVAALVIACFALPAAPAPAASEPRGEVVRTPLVPPAGPRNERPSEPAPVTRPAPPGDSEAADGAIRFLEAKVEDNPGDPTFPTQLGAVCLDRAKRTHDYRHYARAEAALKEAIVCDDKHFEAVVLLGACYLGQHRFREAAGAAGQALGLRPDAPEAIALRGDALLASGETGRAREDYQKLLDAKPDLLAHTRMANLLLAEGDSRSAIESLEAALHAGEDAAAPPALLAWCAVRLGAVHFGAGNWDQADRWYAKALELEDEDPDTLDHRSELLAARGEFNEALDMSARAIRLAPRPEFLQSRGDIYAAMGDATQAFECHEKALAAYLEAAEAGHAHYYHHLVGMFCDVDVLRNPVEAIRWARNDLQARRTVATFDAMAWALYLNDQFEEAAASMDKALRDPTADAHVLHHAGLIYARAGDPVKGRRYLRRAADVNPKFNEFHFHR